MDQGTNKISMSRYKEQLIEHFKTIHLSYPRIGSIGGGQEDDRRYFANVSCDEFLVIDKDIRFRPNIVLDINEPIITSDGMLLDDYYQEFFSCILMLNTWEYIYNPAAAHDNLALMLKAGGTLITNYPFVYAAHEPAGMDYLRYTPDGYRYLLRRSGFEITKEVPITAGDQLIETYKTEHMKARANFDHHIVGAIVFAKKI